MFVVTMYALSSTVRMHNLSKLKSDRFDVLVIGGGLTGAGVALDAAARGYSVALVEKVDFASGTSSKSTKLVHGGIRYLPHFDIGLWMYDGLAGRRNIKRHRHLRRAGVLKLAPALNAEGLKDGYMYYDAQTNDARLTMALIRTAAQHGAVITNYTDVTSFISEQGKIQGAHIHDRIGNQDLEVHARHVVNATGVFSEEVEALTGTEPLVQVQPSKGVHLVLSREDLKLGDAAIVLPETEDKRILFIVPWESRAIFGTTDTGTGDLDHPTASKEDIVYLLKYLNRYLSVTLTEDNIISSYAGYRPLVSPRKAGGSTARVSRTHAVLESPSGLVTIVGGKLTTYRRMAQDTVDVLNRRDGTRPLH